jgi:hypothetical protein
MTPDAADTVLVGVIKRKRDFEIARDQRWYRIPEGRAPRGIHADYLAFFFSGTVFREQNGGIHYYAQRKGIELAHRKDLLPGKKPHSRDEHLYHKIQLGELQPKIPPIVNKPEPCRFAFIYTTWDRFETAVHIRDLYSRADYFVDRVFHVLQQKGLKPMRTWEAAASGTEYPIGPQIRILADKGDIVASTEPAPPAETQERVEQLIYMHPSDTQEDIEASAETILEAVMRLGGPKLVDIPIELY